MAWGSPEKKLGTGGPRGMAGAAAGSVFRVSGAAHRRLRAAGGCCFAGGGWRLRGVEVEDESQALDFVSNGCKID